MKILFVSAVLPYPLHSGGQIRIFNLIKQLSKRHEITLASFIRDESERVHLKNLSFCKEVYTVLRGRAWQAKYVLKALGKYPFLLATYNNSEMRALLSALLSQKSFDLVHLEPFYVWSSVPETTTPIVVSEHNIEYKVYEQYGKKFPLLFAIDIAKLRRWEEFVWKKADYITAVSEKDKSVIQKNVSVVPNGVDITQFTFQKHTTNGHRVLFVGNFRWVANHDAANILVRDIWPLLIKRYPDAILRIVGVDIPDFLKKKAIEIKENVNDISFEYRGSDILIAPHTIAGGTKLKILEAFASGLPVVTTHQGISGLEAKPDIHYKEATSPGDFVAKTTEIWENTKETDHMVHNARILVEEKYTWEKIASVLEGVWNEATN